MSDNTNTTNSAEVILEIQDLCKSFGDHEVLKGISTTIRKGDVLALIGPSGCGKSTFLRSLNLLEIPTSGHVLFEGTDMTDKSVDINHVREKIGMVFQQFNLFPHKTVKQNIMMAPVALKLMTKEEVFQTCRTSFLPVWDFQIRQMLIRICFPVVRSSVLPLQDPLP